MRGWIAAALALALPGAAAAQQEAPDTSTPAPLALHGQATLVVQGTPGFRSPYAGANSLTPDQVRETVDVTLYAGVRPWRGGELWANPEIDQGFGLSNTLGVAGFPSAEAYKVGRSSPYVRLQRLFLRQTFCSDAPGPPSVAAADQFPSRITGDRIVVTLGKFGVGDVFDTNRYAHDPRGDFLNWTVVDAGSFDYAADAWGYATGIAAEAYRGDWTLRGGLFNLSRVPNGETLETRFGQSQIDVEVEHRHRLGGRDGAVRLLVYRNRGRFGRFADALAAAGGGAPDTGDVRAPRSRIGGHLNLEQAVSDTVGVFARAGLTDGSIEPYDFTDVDRTVSAGAAIAGSGWGRAADTLGVAAVANAIDAEHRRYLAAGGTGVLVGDGRLPHPGAELIAEAYYAWRPVPAAAVTVDYQWIGRPGYNRDRGPANVLALRLHGQF